MATISIKSDRCSQQTGNTHHSVGCVRKKLSNGEALQHGHPIDVAGINVLAVPAYNITRPDLAIIKRRKRQWLHVLTIGSLRIYIARYGADTRNGKPWQNRHRIFAHEYALYHDTSPSRSSRSHNQAKGSLSLSFQVRPTPADNRLLASDKEIEVRIRNLEWEL